MKSHNQKVSPTSTMAGACGSEAICAMWQRHYQGLLNSSTDKSKKDSVLSVLHSLNDSDTMDRITPDDIKEAIKALKKGKSKGPDGISAEHLIYCDQKIFYLLSILFNAMIIHAYIPDEFMLSFIIPLVKDTKGDIISKDNYRPIAIRSILSRVVELIILSTFGYLIDTSDNQFGLQEWSLHRTQCVCLKRNHKLLSLYVQ